MNKYTKIKKIILSILLLGFIIFVFTLVAINKNRLTCNSINITILDSNENYFINKNEVLEIIYKTYGNVVGYNFDSINIAEIEKRLNNNSFIKKAEVYKTINGALNVDIMQRNPILRIINKKNGSLYIDNEGVIIPISDNFTSYEIIASGNINLFIQSDNLTKQIKIDENFADKNIYYLYKIAQYISCDEFLSAQIQQIYVTEDNELELIPRVGKHIIEFGTADNYEQKFRNLIIFYQKAINRLGWDKYSKINLKYKNQIVCTIK